MKHFIDQAALRVAILVVALTTVCTTYAGTGSGHGATSSGTGGHGCAGHAMAYQGNHGGGIVSHDCAGAGHHLHGCGGTAYGVMYSDRISAIDRELHERVVKTQQTKDAFMRAHPCPANGVATVNCPGYVIECVNPSPAEPARCLNVSNLEWRLVQRSSP